MAQTDVWSYTLHVKGGKIGMIEYSSELIVFFLVYGVTDYLNFRNLFSFKSTNILIFIILKLAVCLVWPRVSCKLQHYDVQDELPVYVCAKDGVFDQIRSEIQLCTY